ncbi:hypothetical protein N181_22155 [Sinorhizobium fredii USDA 205]|nr:hypothetical protein [Sinorhizobium fredii]ASY71630.1 hypothetical protein SF83666_b49810 [Sinorhizobium fredii CCBAU 83666]AWM29286.1 hypothetical protein AOX55_00006511 [Sinorhizobium fredii CCBAU 25509]KSV86198.1 hypothetical protein N181_22155 [Sinorhizobium fredii USDA 205]
MHAITNILIYWRQLVFAGMVFRFGLQPLDRAALRRTSNTPKEP